MQTCVLKVNIHCEGCKNKVKKILQRIEGIYVPISRLNFDLFNVPSQVLKVPKDQLCTHIVYD